MEKPWLLADKSAIQTLSTAKRLKLHEQYTLMVPALLVTEIAADLSKAQSRLDRTKEVSQLGGIRGVASLCAAFDFQSIMFPAFHANNVVRELEHAKLGLPVPQTSFMLDDKKLFYATALDRMQNGTPSEDELALSNEWRPIAQSTLEEYSAVARSHGLHPPTAKSIEGALALAKAELELPIVASWPSLFLQQCGSDSFYKRYTELPANVTAKPLQEWAPYTYHCLVVFLFGLIAWRDKLIRTSNSANHELDLQYLYYLPFCHVFCSADDIHKRLAVPLLKDWQDFRAPSDLLPKPEEPVT